MLGLHSAAESKDKVMVFPTPSGTVPAKPKSGFATCETHPGGAHNFQAVTVTTGLYNPHQASMLVCAHCGLAHILGRDGKWHQVGLGDAWHDFIAQTTDETDASVVLPVATTVTKRQAS